MLARKDHKTGWSANGVLRTPAGPGLVADGAVQLQIDFGEKNAEYYTLEFNLLDLQNRNDPSGNALFLRAKAEINWSVEGNFIRRLVHVSSGASISGLGQSVAIRIVDDSENPDSDPVIQYPVSVQVSRGTRPTLGGTQPPLYVPRPLLERESGGPPVLPPYTLIPTDSIAIPVPTDSGVNSVYLMVNADSGTPLDPVDVVIQQLGSGIIAANGNLENCNKFIPLVPGANEVQVVNNHTANIRVTPIWGVEG